MCGELGDGCAFGGEGELELLGELFDEVGIAFGLLTTKLVVEVNQVEVLESLFDEGVKQANRITTAGKGKEVASVGGERFEVEHRDYPIR